MKENQSACRPQPGSWGTAITQRCGASGLTQMKDGFFAAHLGDRRGHDLCLVGAGHAPYPYADRPPLGRESDRGTETLE